jgi:hypothetical protein
VVRLAQKAIVIALAHGLDVKVVMAGADMRGTARSSTMRLCRVPEGGRLCAGRPRPRGRPMTGVRFAASPARRATPAPCVDSASGVKARGTFFKLRVQPPFPFGGYSP